MNDIKINDDVFLETIIQNIQPYEEFENIFLITFKHLSPQNKEAFILLINMLIKLEIVQYSHWSFKKIFFNKIKPVAIQLMKYSLSIINSYDSIKNSLNIPNLNLYDEILSIEESKEYKSAIKQLRSNKAKSSKKENFSLIEAYTLISKLYNDNNNITDKTIIYELNKTLSIKLSPRTSNFINYIKPRLEALRNGSYQKISAELNFLANGGYQKNIQATIDHLNFIKNGGYNDLQNQLSQTVELIKNVNKQKK